MEAGALAAGWPPTAALCCGEAALQGESGRGRGHRRNSSSHSRTGRQGLGRERPVAPFSALRGPGWPAALRTHLEQSVLRDQLGALANRGGFLHGLRRKRPSEHDGRGVKPSKVAWSAWTQSFLQSPPPQARSRRLLQRTHHHYDESFCRWLKCV